MLRRLFTVVSAILLMGAVVLWTQNNGELFSWSGSVGWRSGQSSSWAGFTLTEVHAYQGPVLVLQLADPLWALAVVVTAILPVWHLVEAAKRHRRGIRLDGGLCAECGYDLRATPGRCPECGRASAAREA